MSELAKKMIADAQADLASRLTAIEANAGPIEEAEALAATLRQHGITGAKAYGMSFPAWLDRAERIDAWVTTQGPYGDALLQAVRSAGLCINSITLLDDSYLGRIQIDGFATTVDIARQDAIALQTALLRDMQGIAEALANG